MLRLLLFCFIFEIALSKCPNQMTLVSEGECRGKWSGGGYFGSMNDNAAQAISYCHQMASNASPVAIHNEEQQSYWNSKVSNDYFIIGLMCNSNTKRWQWADGTILTFKPQSGFYDIELDGDCKMGCDWYLSRGGSWYHNCTGTNPYTDLYCISQNPPPPLASTDCGNFNDDPDDTFCYEIATRGETWKDAQQICHSFGAELASVHNSQQNSYIRRLAVSSGAVNGVLLGGTVTGKGTDFGWVDGSDWDYTNFYPSFPIDGLGECLTMDTVATAGQWMNTDCATKVPVVCARPYYNSPELAGCTGGPWKEGQIIYSPGFPDDASVPCDYFLTVATGKLVKLEILLLEANSCCDRLVITDGYVAGPVVANLTGEVSGAYYYTSISNTMRVSWLPNGGVNVRGMMMTYWTK